MTDDQVFNVAQAAGFDLVERNIEEDVRMWAWVGDAVSPGWWPSRSAAIEFMRNHLLGQR